MPDPDAPLVDYPKRADEGVAFQQCAKTINQREYRVDALVAGPEHYDTVIIGRWVGSDVPKSAIECNECALLGSACFSNTRIQRDTQFFFKNSSHIVASRPKECHCCIWKVFVGREFDRHLSVVAGVGSGGQPEVLLARELCRVCECRGNCLRCQRWILGEQPLF